MRNALRLDRILDARVAVERIVIFPLPPMQRQEIVKLLVETEAAECSLIIFLF